VATYLNAQAAFKLTLGVPLTEDIHFDDADLDKLTLAGLIGADIDRDAAFHVAVQRHLDILNAIDQFEDSKRKLRVAADQLKPDLAFFSTATLQSEEPYDYANFDLDELRYSVGLSLDLPVDRLRERNAYRAAMVSFESEIRSLALTLDSFKDRIDRGFRTLEQRRLNYLNSQTSLDVARRRVEADELRLEAGRVQIRDVRESQDSLIAAQNDVTTTLVAYLQARLQLLLDIGALPSDSAQFWLKDPLPEVLSAEVRRGTTPALRDDQLLPPDRYLEPLP
jgi:outer membrane protein TolC